MEVNVFLHLLYTQVDRIVGGGFKFLQRNQGLSCTNSFRENDCLYCHRCMTNLFHFHISSSALIRLNKDALEGHLCQNVHNQSSILSLLRKRLDTLLPYRYKSQELICRIRNMISRFVIIVSTAISDRGFEYPLCNTAI